MEAFEGQGLSEKLPEKKSSSKQVKKNNELMMDDWTLICQYYYVLDTATVDEGRSEKCTQELNNMVHYTQEVQQEVIIKSRTKSNKEVGLDILYECCP